MDLTDLLLKLVASATLAVTLHTLKGLLVIMSPYVTAQTALLREGSVAFVAFVRSFAYVEGRDGKSLQNSNSLRQCRSVLLSSATAAIQS